MSPRQGYASRSDIQQGRPVRGVVWAVSALAGLRASAKRVPREQTEIEIDRETARSQRDGGHG
jgi:hypothetical protein